MKICVICGAPPGVDDGVGDFAWLLARELTQTNRVSLIVPETRVDRHLNDAIRIHRVNGGWGSRTSKEVFHIIRRLEPDVLLVHFVPQLYGWNGTKPFLALLLYRLKRMRYPIVTVAHEFNAPFGPSPNLMFWATIHRFLFRIVVASSKNVVTTTLFCCRLLQRRFSSRQRDVRQIPVSSAIPVIPLDGSQKDSVRSQIGIGADVLLVSTFGSAVRSTINGLERLFSWLVGEFRSARLLVIGKAADGMRQETEHFGRLDQMIFTGPVSRQDVSKFLSVSDLYVALYPDGASTRRTSLLAGLAHGLPTVSNLGVLTDSIITSSDAIHFVHDPFTDTDTTALRELCRDAVRRRELGQRARTFYQDRFSWAKIGEQYQQLLREALL